MSLKIDPGAIYPNRETRPMIDTTSIERSISIGGSPNYTGEPHFYTGGPPVYTGGPSFYTGGPRVNTSGPRVNTSGGGCVIL